MKIEKIYQINGYSQLYKKKIVLVNIKIIKLKIL
jgi:hypothetical protein